MPTKVLACVVALVVVGFNAALFAHVVQNAHFSGDDIITLDRAHSTPLREFLLTPIGEHFVPLHRLVAYLADAWFPMSYSFAMLVMEAFFLLGVAYLGRILGLLEVIAHEPGTPSDDQANARIGWLPRSQAGWLLIGLYSVNAYLGALLGWWTAGLHRLPMIAFSIMSIHYYLVFRRSRALRHALTCSLCLLFGLGFFLKAILVPYCWLGLELCLFRLTSPAERRKNLGFVLAWVAASFVYVVVWWQLQPAQVREINWDIGTQLDFLSVTSSILRDGAFGSFYGLELFHRGHQFPFERVVSSLFWIALIAFTIQRHARNAHVWLVLSGLLVLNVLVISMAKHRTGSVGALAALLNQRYYFEFYFLIAIFVAVALARASDAGKRPTLEARLGSGWPMTVLSSLLLALVATRSLVASRGLYQNRKARTYIEHVLADSSRLRAETGGPLSIVDDQAPADVLNWAVSRILPAFGVDVKVAPPGPGVYKVLPSGEIVPSVEP